MGTHVVKEIVPEWSMLSQSRVQLGRSPLDSTQLHAQPEWSEPGWPELGWWSLEVAQQTSGGLGMPVIAFRRFFVFGPELPVPLEAFKLLFHAIPAQVVGPTSSDRT